MSFLPAEVVKGENLSTFHIYKSSQEISSDLEVVCPGLAKCRTIGQGLGGVAKGQYSNNNEHIETDCQHTWW